MHVSLATLAVLAVLDFFAPAAVAQIDAQVSGRSGAT